MSWRQKVLRVVSGHEGDYASLNLNTDGAGLSMGILQWAQRPGQLGVLLVHMQADDPVRFEEIFGDNWGEAVGVAAQGLLEPVRVDLGSDLAAQLWESPWRERFETAGRDERLQAVQLSIATSGEHFVGGVEAARVLGHFTQRSVALMFDRSVQQGPRRAMELAKAAAGLPYYAALRKVAKNAAGRYWRAERPKRLRSGGLLWKQASDGSWHAWAGATDLFRGITRRSNRILKLKSLGDDSLE